MQGVGFRPFVYALATGLGLTGLVGNDLDGVFAEVEGPEAAVAEFLRRLERQAPPLARIERVTTRALRPVRSASFVIAASESQTGLRRTLVSADTATCADCLRELADPADRRHEYPFINCTNCGPRFTIVRDVPYDRPLTTMAPFTMCERCAAEYHDPADRRFHAQPACCPACGPRLAPRRPAGPRSPREPDPGGRRTPPPRPHPRRQGPGRLPPGRRRRLRAGRRRAPPAQAPRGQAVRGHGRRPGRGRGNWPRSTKRPRPCSPARPARSCCCPAAAAPPSRPPPHRATASSASCCRTRRCTTCCSPP